jgi:hypothetical protein
VKKRSRKVRAARAGLKIYFPGFSKGAFTTRIAKADPVIAIIHGVSGGRQRARRSPVDAAEKKLSRRFLRRESKCAKKSEIIDVMTHVDIKRIASSPKKYTLDTTTGKIPAKKLKDDLRRKLVITQ